MNSAVRIPSGGSSSDLHFSLMELSYLNLSLEKIKEALSSGKHIVPHRLFIPMLSVRGRYLKTKKKEEALRKC